MKGGGHEFGYSELAQNYSGEGGHLIVTGLPGSGKTTLLRHLAKEWANGRALKSCQILFLISLGSLEEVNTLGDLLSKSGFGVQSTELEHVSCLMPMMSSRGNMSLLMQSYKAVRFTLHFVCLHHGRFPVKDLKRKYELRY